MPTDIVAGPDAPDWAWRITNDRLGHVPLTGDRFSDYLTTKDWVAADLDGDDSESEDGPEGGIPGVAVSIAWW